MYGQGSGNHKGRGNILSLKDKGKEMFLEPWEIQSYQTGAADFSTGIQPSSNHDQAEKEPGE